MLFSHYSKGVHFQVCVLMSAGLQNPAAEHSMGLAQSGSDQTTGVFKRLQGLEPAAYWLRHVGFSTPLTCLWLLSANQSRAQLSTGPGTTASHLLDEDKDGFHSNRWMLCFKQVKTTMGNMLTSFLLATVSNTWYAVNKHTFWPQEARWTKVLQDFIQCKLS